MYGTLHTMVPWPGSMVYVLQKQFWIIALLSLYSVVSHLFPLAPSFFNIVNTMETNENSWERRKLDCFWHRHSKFIYSSFFPTEITTQLPGKIGTHTLAVEGLKDVRRDVHLNSNFHILVVVIVCSWNLKRFPRDFVALLQCPWWW